MNDFQPGVYHKSVHGGKWLFITTIMQKLLNLITFFVLARMLLPADYGIMAVVFMVTGFFDILTTPGFEKALMQRQGDVEDYLDTLWTFKFLKSILIFSIIFLLSPIVADFFHISEFVSVMRWGAVFILILGPSNLRGDFYFYRNLDFKKIFIRDITCQVAYMIVAIGWALFVEASVWALIAGHLVRNVFGFIMSFVLYPQLPRFSFQFEKLKNLWWYSKWVIWQNVLGYILGILDSAYVGRFLDPAKLGLYTKSRDVAYAPVSPFMNVISRVGFPAYAKMQDKLDKLQEGFAKTIDIVLSITFPLCLLLLVKGDFIVRLILGESWLGLVGPLKVLAIATIFSTLAATIKPIFDAVGRPHINVQLNILQLISSIILFYLGIRWGGIVGAAWATVAVWLINLAYALWQIDKFLKTMWRALWPALAAVSLAITLTLIAVLPLYLTGYLQSASNWLLVIELLALGAVYAGALWLSGRFFKSGPKHTLISILQEIGLRRR